MENVKKVKYICSEIDPLLPNINNIMGRKNYFPKQNQKNNVLFLFFQIIFFMSGLIEDSWILCSAPAFSVLPYHMSCSL